MQGRERRNICLPARFRTGDETFWDPHPEQWSHPATPGRAEDDVFVDEDWFFQEPVTKKARASGGFPGPAFSFSPGGELGGNDGLDGLDWEPPGPMPAASQSKGAKAKKKKGLSVPLATAQEVADALRKPPDPRLAAHFLHFSLCQLRAQAVRVNGDGASFDTALRHFAVGSDENECDVRACEPLMDRFFRGPAAGDKWMPWTTAAGDHELFIARRIYGLAHLSDEEKYALLSGSFSSFSRPLRSNPALWLPLQIPASLRIPGLQLRAVLRFGAGSALRERRRGLGRQRGTRGVEGRAARHGHGLRAGW